MYFTRLNNRRYKAALIICLITLLIIVLPEIVISICASQEEDGRWVNTDPNTRSITRIYLRFVCQDQILNGKLYPPGPPWYMHIFGKCHPTDCDWGEIGAERTGSGFVYAIYRHGFATRYVYAKMSAYRPGQLWVYMYTDFTDAGRPDYEVHNWFRRE